MVRTTAASIRRVAFGSTTTNNVVTYVATLDVDNSDLSLRPGMTAVATIVATERNDVLLVPNTALRFSPTNAAGAGTRPSSGGILSKMMPRPPRSSSTKTAGTESKAPGSRQIWILRDGQPTPLSVQTGISDGRLTEVSGDSLEPGMAVITDQRSAGGA